jgi:hypothetical protein
MTGSAWISKKKCNFFSLKPGPLPQTLPGGGFTGRILFEYRESVETRCAPIDVPSSYGPTCGANAEPTGSREEDV